MRELRDELVFILTDRGMFIATLKLIAWFVLFTMPWAIPLLLFGIMWVQRGVISLLTLVFLGLIIEVFLVILCYLISDMVLANSHRH